MAKLTPKQLLEELADADSSMMIYGAPGIGKSQLVEQHGRAQAAKMKRNFVIWSQLSTAQKQEVVDKPADYFVFVDIRLSQRDPSDIPGIPDLVKGTAWLEYRPHCWLHVLTQKGIAGVLFLDEFNQASPMVTGAAFQLIHDHEAAGRKLDDSVQIIAAGNREQDRANIFELSWPMRDRFIEHELVISVDEWTDWAIKNDIAPSIVAFINSNSSYLYRTDGDKPVSPRAVARASKALKKAEGITSGKESKTYIKVSGAIGEAWATIFEAFLEAKEQLNLKKIFANPSSVKELDQGKMFHLVAAMSEYYNKEKTQDAFDNVLNVLVECRDEQAKIGCMLIFSDVPSFKKFWAVSVKKNPKGVARIVKIIGQYQS